MKYVLITPARNEEKFIGGTLASVCAQTRLPEKWVLVDDASTDKTLQIMQDYARRFPWIEVVQRPQRADRSFAAKVQAFNAGFERLKGVEYDVIGNLDGDLTFDPDYLEFLMSRFEADPKLGVAGTPFLENGYDSAAHSFEGINHVAGGCQMFRAACFKEVGGYIPNRGGGIDWIAVTTARMKGWTTRNFLEKRFNHHRALGTGDRSKLASTFSYGEKDYYLGGSPVWEMFRLGYRMAKKPYILDGIALGGGFLWAAIKHKPRPVSAELMRFHRGEQMKKLKGIFRSLARGKKVDNFTVATEHESAAVSQPSPAKND